ncbi:cytochrome ubiquinol oxidase subunit I, partial [Streptomyces sp. TRM76130]|nr:cytochrome ubiquinol oxidase subunit I [Streptomyces sp. TRM76130]
RGGRVGADAPWLCGRPSRWAASCPPPRHDVHAPPRIRSESPAFDQRHAAVARSPETETASRRDVVDAPDEESGRP